MGDNRDMMIAMLSKIITDRKPKTVSGYVDKYLLAKKEIDDFNDEGQLFAFFENKKPASKHTYLWSLKTVLNLAPEKNKTGLAWIEGAIDVNKKTINNYYQEQKKSVKESDNWISLKELQAYNKRQRTALSAKSNKFTRTSYGAVSDARDWLLTSLYTIDPVNHPPMRVDYNMEIAKDGDELDPQKNYLVIKNKSKKYFVFNDYKTNKTYGSKRIELSKKMNATMNIYLKFNGDNKYLFGENNITKNALQKKIQKAFKGTGKVIGVNMLRHIVISDVVDTGDKLKQKMDIADKMGHSTATQELYKKHE
jgi:hypothetical protein